MAKIKIHFSGVEAANASIQKTLRKMDQVEDVLADLQRSVDSNIQSRYQIRSQLRNYKNEVASISSKTKKLRAVVDDSAKKYRTTESRLLRNTPDHR